MEIWKEIPGFEHYEISIFSKVRSKITGKLLNGFVESNGYRRVTLVKNRVEHRFLMHRLMHEVFIGPIPKHLQIGHLDGTRDNNHIDNLSLVTIKENAGHRKLHGTEPVGEAKLLSKLKEKDVIFIRENPHISARSLGKKYGVSKTAILYARKGRNWAYLNIKGPEGPSDN